MHTSWRRIVTFRVFGKPAPAGSKSGFVVPRKGAQPIFRDGMKYFRIRDLHVAMKDSSKGRPDWMYAVRQAALAAVGVRFPLLDAVVGLRMEFILRRPKGHYGTGRNAGVLKPSAPIGPQVSPDWLKLARGTEDALTGVIWTDDARILAGQAFKRYADRDEQEGCIITVYQVPAATVPPEMSLFEMAGAEAGD